MQELNIIPNYYDSIIQNVYVLIFLSIYVSQNQPQGIKYTFYGILRNLHPLGDMFPHSMELMPLMRRLWVILIARWRGQGTKTWLDAQIDPNKRITPQNLNSSENMLFPQPMEIEPFDGKSTNVWARWRRIGTKMWLDMKIGAIS